MSFLISKETRARETHRFLVEVEHGRAEKLLALGQYLVGGGTVIRRRRVIEGRDFRRFGGHAIVSGDEISLLRSVRAEASFPSRNLSPREHSRRGESLHFSLSLSLSRPCLAPGKIGPVFCLVPEKILSPFLFSSSDFLERRDWAPMISLSCIKKRRVREKGRRIDCFGSGGGPLQGETVGLYRPMLEGVVWSFQI